MPESYDAQLNNEKLKRMKYEILKLEAENLKTRQRTNDAMVDLIRRIITDEVKKIY